MSPHVPRDPLPPDASALSLERIATAARTLPAELRRTPQFASDELSELCGRAVVVKVETVNPLRSFKGRGAWWYVDQLPHDRPLVCASAGNFGQALAYAARRHGRRVHVFVAEQASAVKVARIRQLGARVHIAGGDFDAAKEAARAFAVAQELPWVEDGHEPAIAEGAATIGVELGDLAPHVVMVPVGNGALAAGVGRWLHAACPKAHVVGVTVRGAPAMRRSWREDRPVATGQARTVADGVAVRVPVPAALRELRHAVDHMVEVDDGAVLDAGRRLLELGGLLAEPAGAVALAGLRSHRDTLAGRRTAVVVTGANLSSEDLRRWYR